MLFQGLHAGTSSPSCLLLWLVYAFSGVTRGYEVLKVAGVSGVIESEAVRAAEEEGPLVGALEKVVTVFGVRV